MAKITYSAEKGTGLINPSNYSRKNEYFANIPPAHAPRAVSVPSHVQRVYEFKEPFEPCKDLSQFLDELQTPVKSWLTADQQAVMLSSHPIAPAIIHFPVSKAPAPTPAALTHCWLVTHVMVWSGTTLCDKHQIHFGTTTKLKHL